MKIVVWKTGHQIADTVAESLAEGLNSPVFNALDYGKYKRYEEVKRTLNSYDSHIAYGILRGNQFIFECCNGLNIPWFNCDRGYFNPSHFDGYYRISYKGTQARYDATYPISKEFEGEFEPKKIDYTKDILVCPPTQAVCYFFGIDEHAWMLKNVSLSSYKNPNTGKWSFIGTQWYAGKGKFVVREKGDPNPINWDDYSAVITFNSSVGWEAIRRGIPCLSDTTHSVVGSYYNTKTLDELIELFNTMPRKPLFDFMSSHQFTLDEIRKGNAWSLIQHYLLPFTSDSMVEKQSPPMSQRIPSVSALKHYFQSNT